MTAGGRAHSGDRPPGWKQALALVSLALSLLLWLNGLLDSLQRPSVGGALNRRQLELAVLAAPHLPDALRPVLAGADPQQALAQALGEQRQLQQEAGEPAAADLLLEEALLLRRRDPGSAEPLLQQLAAEGGDPSVRQVARTLLDGRGRSPEQALALTRSLQLPPLLSRWACEALGGEASSCRNLASGERAALQLLAVTAVPVGLVLIGVGLLLRQLWLRWRGLAPARPPLQPLPLSALDTVLLIAGGFVVIGELLTPLLLSPLLALVLQSLGITSPLRDGLSVLALYLALMAGPLLILWLMLRGLGPAPTGGWLQYRWRPLAPCFGQALSTMLMVLPLVSLVGWLQSQLWGDPGGSNPLLSLVLNSANPAALLCFAVTAVVLAPLFEETLFRGVVLPVVAREWGPATGVVISALVFAVAHLSLGELPPLMMLGLGLGWLRLNGGRLSSCVLMHALWNGLTFANLVILGS